MKIYFAINSFFAAAAFLPRCAGQQKFRGLGSARTHCGCLQCKAAIWDKPAQDYSGTYTCGERIEYVKNNQGVTEEEACLLVAGKNFPVTCGREVSDERR